MAEEDGKSKKQDRKQKKQKHHKRKRQQQEQLLSDFIADDEEFSQSEQYVHRHHDSDDSVEKKRKKQKKKDKKRKKQHKKRQQQLQDEYDEDDLQLIDNREEGYTRLKKKKQQKRQRLSQQSDYSNQIALNEDQYEQEESNEYHGSQSGDYGNLRRSQIQSEYSAMQEIMQKQQHIFDPADQEKFKISSKDRQIIQIDIPQRYATVLKQVAQKSKKTLKQFISSMQSQSLIDQESKLIFSTLKQQKLIQDAQHRFIPIIKKILNYMHKEFLDIMYIYTYRQKEIGEIKIQALWRLFELDVAWFQLKQSYKKWSIGKDCLLSYNTMTANLQFQSFVQKCTDVRYQKYVDQYYKFIQAKFMGNHAQLLQKPHFIRLTKRLRAMQRQKKGDQKFKNELKLQKTWQKLAVVTEASSKRLINKTQQSQIFLSPQNFYSNIQKRQYYFAPVSPNVDNKIKLKQLVEQNDELVTEQQRQKYPLLNTVFKYKLFRDYLSYELYVYPDIRRILRKQYFKKLTITTTPTLNGNKQIDIYSIFYPVKRIKQKLVNTLKKQIWLTIVEAEKKCLITVDLKFQWQNQSHFQKEKEGQRDKVASQLIQYYYDMRLSKKNHNISSQHAKNIQSWNIFRKLIFNGMINDHFMPNFKKQVREDLTRQAQKQIITSCCNKLKSLLKKAKQPKKNKILSLVLQNQKLGVAFINEAGKQQHTYQITISNQIQLRQFVQSTGLKDNIVQYKPDMILVAANCKKAQLLRKQLRNQQTIFCSFGQFQVPRLMAKKLISQGNQESQAILQAISMARFKKNPLAQIVNLWDIKDDKNGVLSLNLNTYQAFVNKYRLKQALKNIMIQVVNLVGVDINEAMSNDYFNHILEFVSGLGPKKSQQLIQKFKKSGQIISRKQLRSIIDQNIVANNCIPFFKVQSLIHKTLFQKMQRLLQNRQKQKVFKQFQKIDLLDMTRIPEEWYGAVIKKLSQQKIVQSSVSNVRKNKLFGSLSDQNIFVYEFMKDPQKSRNLQFKNKQNLTFDQNLVKAELIQRFKSPRQKQRVMEDKQIFFSLLKQTPDTLKKYMIMQAKVLSIKRNYLNVIIPQNNLFGYIKLQGNKTQEQYAKIYQKGSTIKTIITGFPFQNKGNYKQQPTQQAQLLKVQLSLQFPHKDNERHEGSKHDCFNSCFPAIIKQLHPLIDLQKQKFQIKKQDRPIIQQKQQKLISQPHRTIKNQFRRITHPKFKNVGSQAAADLLKNEAIGQYIIRPSSQGQQYLTITWKFFHRIIVHIKIKSEQRGINNAIITYRIEDRQNKAYSSLQQIFQKCIKPMNILVQDVVSNKKFSDKPIQEVQNYIKRQYANDPKRIFYMIAVSEEFPQYFILVYMFKDKKPTKELIKTKSTGLYFHDQQFANVRDLITWFKQHLQQKQYQRYVKSVNSQIQKSR